MQPLPRTEVASIEGYNNLPEPVRQEILSKAESSPPGLGLRTSIATNGSKHLYSVSKEVIGHLQELGRQLKANKGLEAYMRLKEAGDSAPNHADVLTQQVRVLALDAVAHSGTAFPRRLPSTSAAVDVLKAFFQLPDSSLSPSQKEVVLKSIERLPGIAGVLNSSQLAQVQDWATESAYDHDELITVLQPESPQAKSMQRLSELLGPRSFGLFQAINAQELVGTVDDAKNAFYFEQTAGEPNGEDIAILLIDHWGIVATPRPGEVSEQTGIAQEDGSGRSHWTLAISQNRPRLLEKLLSCTPEGGPAPLLAAPIQLKEEQLDVEQRNLLRVQTRHAELFMAVLEGRAEDIKALIEQGATPLARQAQGYDMISAAVGKALYEGRTSAVAGLNALADLGIRVTPNYSMSQHPLLQALQKNRHDVASSLLRILNLDTKSPRYGTPFMRELARLGLWDFVHKLHEMGVPLPDGVGLSATNRRVTFQAQYSPFERKTLEVFVRQTRNWRPSNLGPPVISHRLELKKNGDPIHYFSGGLIGERFSELILRIEGTEGGDLAPLLKPSTKNAILNYLMRGRPTAGYCCVDFFNDCLGLYVEGATNAFYSNLFDRTRIDDPHSVKTADMVQLLDPAGNPKHFAVCLQGDLYLSVIGHSGNMEVMSLEDMMRLYGCVQIDQLSLKRNFGPMHDA